MRYMFDPIVYVVVVLLIVCCVGFCELNTFEPKNSLLRETQFVLFDEWFVLCLILHASISNLWKGAKNVAECVFMIFTCSISRGGQIITVKSVKLYSAPKNASNSLSATFMSCRCCGSLTYFVWLTIIEITWASYKRLRVWRSNVKILAIIFLQIYCFAINFNLNASQMNLMLKTEGTYKKETNTKLSR